MNRTEIFRFKEKTTLPPEDKSLICFFLVSELCIVLVGQLDSVEYNNVRTRSC